MEHLPQLITDLALILAVAAVVTIIFKRLKFPLILGYIVSGILISPHFNFFPTVYEISDVQVWGEIGVIFLLFSLGLEFSFKKLGQIGGAASIAAGFEAIGMGTLGFFTGQLLGWDFMDCIFLGGCLTISSSTVIIKTFEDLSLKHRNFANLVYGILVVEDLIAVTILVLLGSFVITRQVNGSEIFFSMLKLIFFLVLWFVAGIFLIPSILKRAKKFLTDEILLIVAIAMCFVMVYLSSLAGFSAALGAFIMGSILAETTKAERIEHLVKPVRDLFGAIFFVSVGMLIDLRLIAAHIVPVTIICLVVIVGKILIIGTGSYISGKSLKVSLQAGMSLALIGEFSFIIASLGNKYNAISPNFYPIIIAVSAITIFLGPSLILASTPFYNWIYKKLPPVWQQKINRYSTEATSLRTTSDWQIVLRSFLTNGIIYTVVLITIILTSDALLLPWLTGLNNELGSIATAVISLLLMAPFLWALVVRNERTEAFARIYAQRKYFGPIWIMRGIKVVLALVFIILLLRNTFSTNIALYAALAILLIIVIFRHRIQKTYDGIEDRFIRNLNNREIEQRQAQALLKAERRNASLAPWDAHLTTFDVEPEAVNVIGKTLQELQWRERIGVNVASIKRGQMTIVSPTKDEQIFPGDRLFIICTDSQEKRLAAILRPDKKILNNTEDIEMKLERYSIENNSPFIGKTIRNSGIRNKIHGIVVGIERNGIRTLNPESNWVFELGDLVWIVGEKKLVSEALMKAANSKE
ncbi:MAG: cation:proton antiporter [Niabella sp.]